MEPKIKYIHYCCPYCGLVRVQPVPAYYTVNTTHWCGDCIRMLK